MRKLLERNDVHSVCEHTKFLGGTDSIISKFKMVVVVECAKAVNLSLSNIAKTHH